MADETPLMQQYQRIKAEHQGEILLFRMGDFYEMFSEDAKLGSKILGLTLTSRNNGAAGRVPLAGVPVKAVEGYIARLVAAGCKVAICEQMEDPKKAKIIVKRQVTEVLTPGTVMTENLLEATSNSFLACAQRAGERAALAWLDLTTGEFFLASLPLARLGDELRRIGPREILLEGVNGLPEGPRGAQANVPLLEAACEKPGGLGCPCTWLEDWRFDRATCVEGLKKHFGVATFNGFGIEDDDPALVSAGVLLDYAGRMQPAALAHIVRLQPYFPGDYMVLDRASVANLELVSNFSGGRGGTLLETLDRTLTAMGARTLRRWVLEPLQDFPQIEKRLDRVAAFHSDSALRRGVRDLLAEVADIERLVGRISSQRAGPRELASLAASLGRIPELKAGLADSGNPALAGLGESLREYPQLVAEIGRALSDDLPALLADGNVIRAGYNAGLDELRSFQTEGKDWLVRLEADQRARSGIGNLKVKYNRVFGYFIEVTRSNLHLVPADYIRKQTISGGERFITPELKEYENKVLGAEEKIAALEYDLFCALREHAATFSAELQETAAALACLDVAAALAEVAADLGYVRPSMVEGDRIFIREGRHPVVERMVQGHKFVPNDIELDNRENQIIVLTGPNMAGKSTLLRQVGLIVLLAHVGSFVPAAEAAVCRVDRIFTRVGASDNLARGQSTFMVEMNETANILNNASPASLILLDEIGRGTSTFDGLSIAWSVTEYLHEQPSRAAKTIFATHYHELTELESLLPRVKNFNVMVKDYGERVIFLHKIQRGGSDRSYGIQVARLAGIPQTVLERAREVLANLEGGEFSAGHVPRLASGSHAPRAQRRDLDQLSLFAAAPGPPNPAVERLKDLDPDSLTPIEALKILYELKKDVDK
ncbi:DNA mismatch repair protein MutS [bacterium]|nr:DNA mismatch repair protein MutS [bacterium]